MTVSKKSAISNVHKLNETQLTNLINRKEKILKSIATIKKVSKKKKVINPVVIEPIFRLRSDKCVSCNRTIRSDHPHYPRLYRPDTNKIFVCLVCSKKEPRQDKTNINKTVEIKHTHNTVKKQKITISFDEYRIVILGPYAESNKLARWIKDVLKKANYRERLLPLFKETNNNAAYFISATESTPWHIHVFTHGQFNHIGNKAIGAAFRNVNKKG